MEKDTASRLRRAVKENNLFLVKRLIHKVDMRNPDPTHGRYTSLAWAATCGHQETFEFLLNSGHDDEELSKDAENNTILILLASVKADIYGIDRQPFHSDVQSVALHMAQIYYDRYPFTLDWSNTSGKTALHMASLNGNLQFVRMLTDMGSDIDLPDLQGNSSLHYASAWGHHTIVQLLIERGCRFAARNNEGFTALDYAYSDSTMETLQDSARQQFEENKRARKNKFQAQMTARGEQSSTLSPDAMDDVSSQGDPSSQWRFRSGSNATTATTTSGSTDFDSTLLAARSQPSASSSSSSFFKRHTPGRSGISSPTRAAQTRKLSSGKSSSIPDSASSEATTSSQSVLTPVATRMREQDADAIAQFMDVLKRGQGVPASHSAVVDAGRRDSTLGSHRNLRDLTKLARSVGHHSSQPSLRPSASAAQLKNASTQGFGMISDPPPSPPGLDTTDSFEMATPRASEDNMRGKHESITPPANKRSPFSILSRAAASHHESSKHRRGVSSSASDKIL